MKKVYYILIMLFLSLPFGFSQENPEDVALADDQIENDFYESLKQRAIENYDKAITAIQKCIDADDKNPVFYHELGKNYLKLKQYPQAENAFKKAVSLNDKERWYWNGLYDVYYESKDFEKSISVVQKLITFDANMKDDLVSLYMYTNRTDEALALLKEMQQTTVLSKSMEFYLLKLEQTQPVNKPDIALLEKAIKANPKTEQNYIDLILLYSSLGQEAKAFEVAKVLSNEVPNSDWAKISLFKFHLSNNEGKTAAAEMLSVFRNHKIDMKIKQRMLNEFLIFVNKTNTLDSELAQGVDLLSSDETINTPLEIGKFYYSKKAYEKAAFYLEKGIAKQEDDLSSVSILFDCYITLSNYDTLEKKASNYIDLFPTQPKLYYYVGLAENKKGQFKKAKDNLETGLEFLIDNPELEYYFYLQLAESFKGLSDTKQQQVYLSKAEKLAKNKK